jgi:SAM-dependent methyltransferase
VPALQSMLALPAVYSVFRRLVGGGGRERFIHDYLRPWLGCRVLDLGCGPGDLLADLPPCDSVGVDLDPNYITAAQAKYGTRGAFRCEPAEAVVAFEPASFDLVVMTGLLHHLDDAQAAATLAVARKALRPGGRLVTLDGVFVPEQSRAARWVLGRDRGEYVRDLPAYLRLAEAAFPAVTPHVLHDLIRIPYTHLILDCTAGAGR